jgi:hypothetical protein
MQISRTALLGLLGAATSALALEIPEGTGTEILADLQTEAIKNLKKQESCGSRKHNSTCTLENATVRRDWYGSLLSLLHEFSLQDTDTLNQQASTVRQ